MQYKTYRTVLNGLEIKAIQEHHLLVAGETGSGKSVFVRRFMRACCAYGYEMLLLDPKVVELSPWKYCANCIGYASAPNEIEGYLRWACEEMDRRYAQMGRQMFNRDWNGPHMWIIVEEYADLITLGNKKEVKRLCMRIAQKGRAAGIHLLLTTQRPTGNIIDGDIKVNIEARIALKTANAQDSRNITGYAGAESLNIGECYYLERGSVNCYRVPYMPLEEEEDCVIYMSKQTKAGRKAFRGYRRRAWGR